MNKNDSYRQKQSHEYAMNEVVNTQNDMLSHFDDRFLDLQDTNSKHEQQITINYNSKEKDQNPSLIKESDIANIIKPRK